MKLLCNPDEWWPVLSLGYTKFYDQPGEFTPEEIERFQKVQNEFNACQALIAGRCGIKPAPQFYFLDLEK